MVIPQSRLPQVHKTERRWTGRRCMGSELAALTINQLSVWPQHNLNETWYRFCHQLIWVLIRRELRSYIVYFSRVDRWWRVSTNSAQSDHSPECLCWSTGGDCRREQPPAAPSVEEDWQRPFFSANFIIHCSNLMFKLPSLFICFNYGRTVGTVQLEREQVDV